jgi:16S rRNA (adenine(1408)-N(1))-methyltransferase
MAPAGRRIQRRRLANALLVAARAEDLPPELYGLAGAVHVHFPWGSLLRGLVRAEPAIAAGVARITRPGSTVTVVLSVTDRERALGLPTLDGSLTEVLAAGYAEHGLALTEWRPANEREITATRSSWAKRLGAGARRDVWLLRLTRCP